MMRRCIVLAAAFVAAFTIPAETVKTASQPWVTNHVAQAVAPLASRSQVVEAVEPKADAHPTITTTVGGSSTNETGCVVYANVSLVIREVPAANGQKQFRLIRKN